MSGFLGSLIGAISSAVSSVVDPFFNYVTLLLNGDGTNGAQNNTFVDSGTNNFAVTRTGTPTQGTFSPFSQTGWSGFFGSSGSYVTSAANADAAMGTGNFTMEFFLNLSALTSADASNYQTLLGCNNGIATTGNFLFMLNYPSSTNLTIWWQNNAKITVSAPGLTIGTWKHIALVRSSTTALSLYIDGLLAGSATIGSTDTYGDATAGFIIGNQNGTTARYTNGYISNVRITKGGALYSGTSTTVPNFTVPTSPLTTTVTSGTVSLLTLQSNRFVDNSTPAKTLTTSGTPSIQSFSPFAPSTTTIINPTWWGGHFNGSTDYVTTTSAAMTLSNTDFTIEGWFFATSASTTQGIAGCGPQATGTWNVFVNYPSNAGKVSFNSYNVGTYHSSTTFVANTWNHFAVVRNGGVITVYLNGVGNTGVSDTTTFSNTNFVTGRSYYNASQEYFSGYLNSLRIVKSVAVYTGNFTPPTGLLQTSGAASAASYPSTTNVNTTFAASSCALLTLQDSTLVDNAPSPNTLTANGRMNMQNFSPFAATGWSGLFNGSTDYLTQANNASFQFGGSDFSVEALINLQAAPGTQAIVVGAAGTSAREFYVQINSNRTVTFFWYYNGSTANSITTTATVPLNAWCWVCAIRTGSVVSLYIDGANKVTSSISGTLYSAASQILEIGREASFSGSYTNAYISNVRINKATLPSGYDANAATLTVPTAPLTAVTGTSLLTLQSNRFVDNSTANAGTGFPLTVSGTPSVIASSPFPYTTSNTVVGPVGGSLYQPDASANYLGITNTASVGTFTGDFTIEAWVYRNPTAVANNPFAIIDMRSGSGGVAWAWFLWDGVSGSGTGALNFYTGTDRYSASTISNSQWTHVVVSRSGSTISQWISGVKDANTFTLAGTITATATTGRIASMFNNFATQGYLANLRIVNGTAVYTGNFTPPTKPLTFDGPTSASSYPSTTNVNTVFPATQCSLLMNFTNAGILDATSKNDLVTAGTAQVNTSIKQFGTGSMKFGGVSTDYVVTTSANQALILGTSFTVEMWIYPIANGGDIVIGTANNTFQFGYNGTTAFGVAYLGVAWRFTTTTLPALNTWTFVELVRTGTGANQTSLYYNGTLIATGTVADVYATDTPVKIGSTFNGYIDDLRITKGVARANSVPTQAFPVQ